MSHIFLGEQQEIEGLCWGSSWVRHSGKAEGHLGPISACPFLSWLFSRTKFDPGMVGLIWSSSSFYRLET